MNYLLGVVAVIVIWVAWGILHTKETYPPDIHDDDIG